LRGLNAIHGFDVTDHMLSRAIEDAAALTRSLVPLPEWP
jgi:hypothetical protein